MDFLSLFHRVREQDVLHFVVGLSDCLIHLILSLFFLLIGPEPLLVFICGSKKSRISPNFSLVDLFKLFESVGVVLTKEHTSQINFLHFNNSFFLGPVSRSNKLVLLDVIEGFRLSITCAFVPHIRIFVVTISGNSEHFFLSFSKITVRVPFGIIKHLFSNLLISLRDGIFLFGVQELVASQLSLELFDFLDRVLKSVDPDRITPALFGLVVHFLVNFQKTLLKEFVTIVSSPVIFSIKDAKERGLVKFPIFKVSGVNFIS